MTVRLWVLLAVVIVAATAVTVLGYVALHEHGELERSQRTLAARDKLWAQSVTAYRENRQAYPEDPEVTVLPAPWNVTVVCTITGSSEGPDGRVPLDPKAGPAVGDLWVKTCRGLAASESPKG